MKADTVTKDYVKDASVFADIFNYYIYGGRQVIRPEQLVERDSVKITLPYGADGAAVPVQRFRDAQKLYAAMTDGKMEYVLYGVENQSEIHYAMAVKNNLYDALEYAGQVEEAAKSHREERRREKALKEEQERLQDKAQKEEQEKLKEAVPIKVQGEVPETTHIKTDEERKTPNTGEFLSGFWKEDRLIPSVTVTIFFGAEEWDGPLSLFDMMDVEDPEVLACMDNYHVRLIAPAQMMDEEIMKFQSSLREVMFFIKYSDDSKELKRILEINEKRFRELERRAADVIEAVTNSGIKYEADREVVDVCNAIREIRMEERRIGELDGERRGELRGEQRGEQKGELKKAQEDARNFYRLGLDVEKVAEGVGYAVETVKEWIGLSDTK